MNNSADFNDSAGFLITDALTGDVIEFDHETGDAALVRTGDAVPACKSLFFPGCSLINYAMPLAAETYGLLKEHGAADGISVLCCGKILSYEPDGENVRAAFERQLCEHVASAGIERVICACPNCMKAMRDAFSASDATSGIEVAALPQVFREMGYKLDRSQVAGLLKGSEDAEVLLCTHDSCPDREYGEFADGMRSVLPDEIWADPEHSRSRSVCCGSLPRAAGKVEQADRCADICGSEAAAISADAIVTICMSCAFQLNMAQSHVPCVHLLELVFGHRVDWRNVGLWMKLRFLFDETLGVIDKTTTGRDFAGLGASRKDENDL